MHIRMFINRSTLLIITLSIYATCFSQQKTVAGLNLAGEKTSSSDFALGVGGTFERQFMKHHGFETGLFYRTFKISSQVFVDALPGVYNGKEEYLSVPILYKFYFSIFNFSLGPTFDVYTGWKKGKGSLFEQNIFHEERKFNIGLMGKISKTINLSKRILLEPEVRYNPLFYNHRSFYGIGLPLKYKLAK